MKQGQLRDPHQVTVYEDTRLVMEAGVSATDARSRTRRRSSTERGRRDVGQQEPAVRRRQGHDHGARREPASSLPPPTFESDTVTLAYYVPEGRSDGARLSIKTPKSNVVQVEEVRTPSSPASRWCSA